MQQTDPSKMILISSDWKKMVIAKEGQSLIDFVELIWQGIYSLYFILILIGFYVPSNELKLT